MLNERMQILLSSEQRRRLETEARRRQTSVAALIREAIDARFGTITREERQAAVAAIAARKVPFLSPEEINRIVAEEREAAFPYLEE